MKKGMIVVVLVLMVFSVQFISGTTLFRVTEESKKTEYIDGVRHQELIGTVNYNGTVSYQKINYLGANPTKDGMAIVTSDNYLSYSFGKGTLETLKNNIHARYDQYQVVGGVNGDFFGANGIPISAYIRDYNVISAGLGYGKSVIGFKDNGDLAFHEPSFDGYELLVYNKEDEIKTEIRVDGINTLATSGDGVFVYFDNYDLEINNSFDKIVIRALETHFDDWGHTFYGKGLLESETKEILSVEDQRMVIVGDNINHDDLIGEGDYVVIQQNLSGEWEDVRFAISGWEILVADGKATEVFTEGVDPSYRHPRTAIGVKEDGTVFFITVDGRDDVNGFKGMTEYELSQVMLHYGAVDAFNLDGGGSTSMLLKNEEGDYEYVNTPSDGAARSVSNGVFFVLGQHKEREYALWPDTREELAMPLDFYMSKDGYIDFSDVAHAKGYEVMINDEQFIVDESEFQSNLEAGAYDIKVRALGDKTDYKSSLYTDSIRFHVYSEDMQSIIDYFNRYSKEEVKD